MPIFERKTPLIGQNTTIPNIVISACNYEPNTIPLNHLLGFVKKLFYWHAYELVEQVLQYHGEIVFVDSYWNFIFENIRNGTLKVEDLRYLFQKGVKLNKLLCSANGYNLIQQAVLYKQNHLLQSLLNYGVSIQGFATGHHGHSALHLAAIHAPSLIKWLLQHGASVTVKNNHNQTAIDTLHDRTIRRQYPMEKREMHECMDIMYQYGAPASYRFMLLFSINQKNHLSAALYHANWQFTIVKLFNSYTAYELNQPWYCELGYLVYCFDTKLYGIKSFLIHMNGNQWRRALIHNENKLRQLLLMHYPQGNFTLSKSSVCYAIQFFIFKSAPKCFSDVTIKHN